MATLMEAIENVRDRHLIAVLEEGTTTELQALKTKQFLNENLGIIRKVLVEEGVVDGARQHLANNWGKYAAGAGVVGAGAAAHAAGLDTALASGFQNPDVGSATGGDAASLAFNAGQGAAHVKDTATDLAGAGGAFGAETNRNLAAYLTSPEFTNLPDDQKQEIIKQLQSGADEILASKS